MNKRQVFSIPAWVTPLFTSPKLRAITGYFPDNPIHQGCSYNDLVNL